MPRSHYRQTGQKRRTDEEKLELGYVRYFPNGLQRCWATNRAGTQCGKRALEGKDYCEKHGGRQQKTDSGGNLKHGRYAHVLRKDLAEKYQAYLDDPDLMSLDSEIAAQRALVADIMSELHAGDMVKAETVMKWLGDIGSQVERQNRVQQRYAFTGADLRVLLGLLGAVLAKYLSEDDLESVFAELDDSGLTMLTAALPT